MDDIPPPAGSRRRLAAAAGAAGGATPGMPYPARVSLSHHDEPGPVTEPRAVPDELARNPHPAVHRAAFAARYPRWGAATLAMLVVGVAAGYVCIRLLSGRLGDCVADPARPACASQAHVVAATLPVGALVVGLTISLLGGRVVARTGRSPLLAAAAGWAVFLTGGLTGAVLLVTH